MSKCTRITNTLGNGQRVPFDEGEEVMAVEGGSRNTYCWSGQDFL